MSSPCLTDSTGSIKRVDSPVPIDVLGHADAPFPAACADEMASVWACFDREDGARTPRALSPRPTSIALQLPVCVGTTARPALTHRLGPALCAQLEAISPMFSQTYLSWVQMDNLLQEMWLRIRPCALQQSSAVLRLLRPDDDPSLYQKLVSGCCGSPGLHADDFAYIIANRLRHQHYTVVVALQGCFIATASLLIQSQLSTTLTLLGHLDEFYVAEAWRDANLGPSVTNTLIDLGDRLGVCGYAVTYDWRGTQGPHF